MNALRIGAFRVYFVAFFVSGVGTWMHSFAQSWLLYRMTGNNGLYLGYLGLLFALPMTLLTPFGGGLSDRFPRRALLTTTQLLSAGLALLMAFAAARGALAPWHILASQFTFAVLLAVDNPARQSLVPDVVPKEALPSALALNSAIFTGAALVGPMVGGLLIGRLGAHGLFALNAASFAIPLLTLRGLVLPAAPVGPRPAHDPLGGFRYLWATPALRKTVLFGVWLALFGRSYVQVLPVFATQHFHRGAAGYSAMLSAGGVGALLGAGLLAAISHITARERVMALGALLGASSLVVFAKTSSFPLGLGALVIAGGSAVAATTAAGTIVQTTVPPALRGRVVALHVVTVIGLPYLGSLVLAALGRAWSQNLALVAFATASGLGALLFLVMARPTLPAKSEDMPEPAAKAP